MKLFRVIMYIYLWLIVGFMLLMSLDAFDVTSSWDEQFLGFIIHFLPGLMLGAALLLMKKKIRYYAFWAIGFFYLFLYNPFGNIQESWYIIVFIILPVLVSGARYKNNTDRVYSLSVFLLLLVFHFVFQ